MSATTQNVRRFVFTRTAFTYDATDVQGSRLMQPHGGTWDTPRKGFSQPHWKALVCCPACRAVSVIASHDIDPLQGRVTPVFQCTKECGFLAHIVLRAWGRQELFCVAWEREHATNPADRTGFVYMFADSEMQSRAKFRNTRAGVKGARIVAAGPVIGYYSSEKDYDGLQLSVG
jgi:hypothetical protein